MTSIKENIYKLAKNMAKKKEIDIEPEELAALATYNVLNLPYFEKTNNFLSLSYNVFEEITMGHISLNNVRGYTNSTIENFTVKFDMDEKSPGKFDNFNAILKKADKQILMSFIDILNSNNTTHDIVAAIMREEEKNNQYYNTLLNLFNANDKIGYNKGFLKQLDFFIPYDQADTDIEILNHLQNKQKHYRSSSFSNPVYDNILKYSLKGCANDSVSELMERLSQDDINTLTGVRDITSENYNQFKDKYPLKYEKSILKILEGSDTALEKESKIYDLKELNNEKQIFIHYAKKTLSNPTFEDLLEKYKDEIEIIMDKVYKYYPQLDGSMDTLPYILNIENHEGGQDFDKLFHKHTDNDPLEIYQDDYRACNMLVVRGNSFFSHEFNKSPSIYVSAYNGLEDIVASEGFHRKSVRLEYSEVPLENIRISRIFLAARHYPENVLADIIETYVKMAQNSNKALVHDIYERHYGLSSINDSFEKIINDLSKKYEDSVIFINDGYKSNDKESFKSRIKSEMLVIAFKENFSHQQMLICNKAIEKYANTDDFKRISEMDYFDRKKDTDAAIRLAQILDIGRNQNKKPNHSKVKI